MDAALTRLVWRRARSRCEYCQMSQEFDDAPFEIDHIISKKHHGLTVSSNLALSCFHCNSFKGSNIDGRDLLTHKFSQLFNPRRHKWNRHFHWEGAYLRGRTAVGRVTIDVLNINDPLRVELRQELIEEGIFPP
jgi:HNH endonuclease